MPDTVRINPKKSAGREKILASAQAIERSREALDDFAPQGSIGEYVGVVSEGERLLAHAFECLLPGYPGWFWAVTLTRLPRSTKVTINDMALCPGTEALLAPAWIPWEERLTPDDVSAVDRLPYKEHDSRLEQGYEAAGDEADELAIYELGLGRERVLSAQGRDDAFARWYSGEHGPRTVGTRAAHARCATCGFFMPMAGSARQLFGVCANEWSVDDGTVVSLDHGCGSHSETDAPRSRKMWNPAPPVVNELDLDVIEEK